MKSFLSYDRCIYISGKSRNHDTFSFLKKKVRMYVRRYFVRLKEDEASEILD
jgi:hypothetical protein